MASRVLRPHHLAALALACVLSSVWAVRDWHALSVLRLPDTDDVMRLQQIRDWIAGQPFADVSQHRLAGGLAMHWSRIGDVVPAALILALRPFTGQHAAEIAAVIAWPVVQFALLLGIVGSIAERLSSGARGTAIVLAALAYPASALFLPGRIDHHAMQLILVLVQLRALLAPPDWRSGAVAGAAAAIGAAIGLETIPFAIVTGALVAWQGGHRQLGFGAALALGLAALLPIAGHGGTCDTIAPLAPLAIAGGIALMLTARLGTARLPALALVGVGIAWLGWGAVSPCLAGPYGTVDPLVARLWLANVEEARPLLSVPLVQLISYAGLMLVGVALALAVAWRRRGGWTTFVAYQLVGLTIALAQLRGVYVGTALAAVPIAVLLAEARAAGRMLRVAGLWIAGAGLLYPIAASALVPQRQDADAPSCTAPDALARLNGLPPGRLMAPIDVGPYAIGATGLEVIAAPYHRNDAGNAAMYRFFLGPPTEARAIADRWAVTSVALCPGAFSETHAVSRGSIAGGARPDWLVPVSPPGSVPELFVIHRRLPPATAAR